MTKVSLSALLFAATLAASPLRAQESSASTNAAPSNSPSSALTVKSYELKQVGNLHLTFPRAWQDTFNRTIELNTRVDTIKFLPREGDAFAIIVDVNHMADLGKVRDFDTKSVIVEAVQRDLTNSVETTPEVHNFKGPEVTGSYLSLTDKTISASSPKPGEYKYLTSGYAKISTLIISFRMVSNQANSEEQAALLETIKSIHLTPPE